LLSVVVRKGLELRKKMMKKVDLEWNDDHVVPEVVYPDLAFLFQRMIEETLNMMAADKGERILDIGCGRAIDAVELAKEGGECIGLEPSEVMINHAKSHIASLNAHVALVQGVGEELPFETHSFDKVMCKGALDHFLDPQKTVKEISRVLKPNGKAVISIANFESLGFRLGRNLYPVISILSPRNRVMGRKTWEIPPDHTYKFDYPSLVRMVEPHLEIEKVKGVSLLFGLPWWSSLLARLPKSISSSILSTLDKIACHFPRFSDVIVLRCNQKNQARQEI
jgi:2-polyprenyl-3-methyl-5-hydroxy-6-metoxy-1,4-benzoquinol methylase